MANIETYKELPPRFTGTLTADATGRMWRLSLIPIDPATGGGSYLTESVRWSNLLTWRVGRGDENKPTTVLATSCSVALADPNGAVADWLFGFDDTERIKLLVEELATPGLDPALGYDPTGTPRFISWVGALYSEGSEAPYYQGVRAETLELTAYDQLGKMGKEDPVQIDSEGVPVPRALDEIYSEILWSFANLDIEVIQSVVAAGSTLLIEDLFLGQGVEGDDVREQLDLLMQSFGTRAYQSFQGRWRIQHSRTWGETIRPASPGALTDLEKRSQILLPIDRDRNRGGRTIRRTAIAAENKMGNPVDGLVYNVDPLGDSELMRGRLRKAGTIKITRQGQENYTRDPKLEQRLAQRRGTNEPARLRHWSLWSGPDGRAHPSGDKVKLTGNAGMVQAVLRISPIDAYARLEVKADYLATDLIASVVLVADDGRHYAWNDRYEQDTSTGRPYQKKGWFLKEPEHFPADFGATFQISNDKWPFLTRTFKYSVPLSRLPGPGTLYVGAWTSHGLEGEIHRFKVRIVDSENNDLPSFDVSIGDSDDRETLELSTIGGIEIGTSGSPATFKDLSTQTTFVDLVEWQSLDTAAIRGVDSTRLEGRLRRIVPPEAALQARTPSAEAALFLPISLQVTAAPTETTSGTWLELPPS